jgi:hypothetical protein
MTRRQVLRRRIRVLLVGFIIGLLVSGVTAFPLPYEVTGLADLLGLGPDATPATYPGLLGWIVQVREGLKATDARFPFLFYGTDWLAFAHIVIAILFVGPVKDPVRNVWVIKWGVIACILVIPLALICGSIRGIPFEWRLIDCSFGMVGIVPLLLCLRWIRELERQ